MGLLTNKLEEIGKLYTEIQFVLSDVREWIPENKLNDRRYVRFFPIIEEYKKLIENEKQKLEKKNIFGKLFTSDDGIEIVQDFERKNKKAINEVKNCTKCACFKCKLECKMKGCNQCQEGVGCRIGVCKCGDDIEDPCSVYIYEDKTMQLYDGDAGYNKDFHLLGMVYDLNYDIYYLILEHIGGRKGEDRKVYFYNPKAPENEMYDTVTDVDDLNMAVDAFEEAYMK